MCQDVTGGGAKPVVVEVLKAEDVKQADGLLGLIWVLVNDRVDFVHHPDEKFSVDSLEGHVEELASSQREKVERQVQEKGLVCLTTPDVGASLLAS